MKIFLTGSVKVQAEYNIIFMVQASGSSGKWSNGLAASLGKLEASGLQNRSLNDYVPKACQQSLSKQSIAGFTCTGSSAQREVSETRRNSWEIRDWKIHFGSSKRGPFS
jgi:hypothetical protein